MDTLSDFKRNVEIIHENCACLFQGAQEPYITLSQELMLRKQECEEQLRDFGPRIMLFGNYNAGKSTLLNALLGEERAAVGDVPITYKEDRYLWNGYHFIDTPGVNAPIEHEALTLEQLKCNDVVLFVISSLGSFEDRQIYEHMRNIFHSGKQLILVINNKSDASAVDKNLQDIKNKVISNVQARGSQPNSLKNVSIHVVNAEEALLGRLSNEQEIVEASGILLLEETILRELRRTDAFIVLRRLLRNLESSLRNAANVLDSTLEKDGESKTLNCHLQDELRQGGMQIRAAVERVCSGFDAALFACLPKPEAAASVDNEAISQKFAEELQNYSDAVNEELQLHTPPLLQCLADAVHERAPECINFGHRAEDMDVIIPDTPGKVIPSTSSASAGESESDTMLATKVGAVIALLPKILPLPIPVLAFAPLLGPIVDLFRAVFGASIDEQHRAQLVTEVAARNEAERQNALNIAIWRQEAREACASYANKAMRKLQNSAQEQVESLAAVYLVAATRMESEKLRDERKTIEARDACFAQLMAVDMLRQEMQ